MWRSFGTRGADSLSAATAIGAFALYLRNKPGDPAIVIHLKVGITQGDCRAISTYGRVVGLGVTATEQQQCTSNNNINMSNKMGLFDFIQETLLDSRDGDFVPLEQSSDKEFGPGPLIIMYAVPELMDMADNMGISGMLDEGEDDNGEELLDMTFGEALSKAMDSSYTGTIITTTPSLSTPEKPIVVSSSSPEKNNNPSVPSSTTPQVSNTEMMDTYRIMANGI
ncbi:hypothetical protein ACHAXR_002370 [Thalassiosira sp. AJA248-18]